MAADQVRSLSQSGKELAGKVIHFQIVTGLLAALLFFFFSGTKAAISSGYGALAAIIPNVIFAWFSFRYAGARQSQNIVKSISRGSKVKFLTTVILIVVAFKVLGLLAQPLLITLAVTLVAQWLPMLNSTK